jgi:hypothetical protein
MSVRARVVVLLTVIGGTIASGQERGLQKVHEEAENALSLSFRVQTRDGSGLRSIVDGETLKTGDLVQFVMAVDQPAYVYVVQYFADGSAAVLHPEEGDALLRPGYEARIPEPGQVFKLVPPAGEEVIYFIATRRTLGEADERVAEAVRMIRVAGGNPRPSPQPSLSAGASIPQVTGNGPGATPPPPSAFGLGTRGRLVKVPSGGSPLLTIRSGPDGVAIYAFTIRHKAAG